MMKLFAYANNHYQDFAPATFKRFTVRPRFSLMPY